MMEPCIRLLIAVGIAAWLAPAAPAQDRLAQLLARGADYVAAYAPRVSGVILDEHYVLIEIGSGRMMVPRRLSSDVVLINLNGETIALRDGYAIDNVPLREHLPRINTLLAAPTVQAWALAQEYDRQSHLHFAAAIVVTASEPTLALRFLAAAQQTSLRFRLDGQKKMNGVAVAGIRFEEPKARGTQYLLKTRGNASSSGRIWLDPDTGAVHQTELWLDSPTEVARVTVAYAPEPKLGLILPLKLTGTFEERILGVGPDAAGSGVYNARQAIESTVTYSNPRLLPIDLTRMRQLNDVPPTGGLR